MTLPLLALAREGLTDESLRRTLSPRSSTASRPRTRTSARAPGPTARCAPSLPSTRLLPTHPTRTQIDIVNELQLLTAKPVTYLVNLSEKDYIRKKNKWLPKIHAWIAENTPGDLLIPFSVALEERLAQEFGNPEAQKAELEKLGTVGALNKITTAGYASLHVRPSSFSSSLRGCADEGSSYSSFGTSPVDLSRCARGPFGKAQRLPLRPV